MAVFKYFSGPAGQCINTYIIKDSFDFTINTIGTPISEISNSNLSLSPNPTTNQLTVNSSVPIEQINIYNTAGQLVMAVDESSQIDISSLPKGVYMAEVTPKSPKGDLNTAPIMRRWVKM